MVDGIRDSEFFMTTILDMPDDYPWLPGSTRYPLADLGELAARMGSLVTYDRRGEVIWATDMRQGLSGWATGGAGTGNKVILTADYSMYGGFTLALVGGSDSTRLAEAIRYFSPATLGKAGLEIAVAFTNTFSLFYVQLQRFDGSTRYLAQFKLDLIFDRITVRTDTSSDQKIDDLNDPVSAYGYHHNIKLVADFENNTYIRLLYDQTEYDLSAYNLYEENAVDVAQHRMNIYHHSSAGDNDVAYVDRVILSANEP